MVLGRKFILFSERSRYRKCFNSPIEYGTTRRLKLLKSNAHKYLNFETSALQVK